MPAPNRNALQVGIPYSSFFLATSPQRGYLHIHRDFALDSSFLNISMFIVALFNSQNMKTTKMPKSR